MTWFLSQPLLRAGKHYATGCNPVHPLYPPENINVYIAAHPRFLRSVVCNNSSRWFSAGMRVCGWIVSPPNDGRKTLRPVVGVRRQADPLPRLSWETIGCMFVSASGCGLWVFYQPNKSMWLFFLTCSGVTWPHRAANDRVYQPRINNQLKRCLHCNERCCHLILQLLLSHTSFKHGQKEAAAAKPSLVHLWLWSQVRGWC